MARGGTQGTLGVAVALQRPVPAAGRADADGRGPFGRVVLLRARRADLDAAFNQLRQYAFALENPPLLIVSDMARCRICTNWTNSVSMTHEFALEDLAACSPKMWGCCPAKYSPRCWSRRAGGPTTPRRG